MTATSERGFRAVLGNRHFRELWLAQLLAQTSQHAIHFIQLVLVEQLTGSAMQIGITILAFTVPGILFSPIAGVLVDRVPKKWILLGSNLLRVIFALSYIPIVSQLDGTPRLLAIYVVTFLTATVAQFFAPAEGATIPLLVGEKHLIPANSLFTLTLGVAQVLGLMVLGPVSINFLNVEGGFVVVAIFYLVAALSVSRLPVDRPLPRQESATSGWQQLWGDIKESLQFIRGQRRIQAAITQLVTITTLIMIMAMLAPGYAARVLGMSAGNAVIVLAPAGLGMLLAIGITGRWGYLLRRYGFTYIGLIVAGLAFAGMGWVALGYNTLMAPILRLYPNAAFSLTSATMALAFVLGLCLAGVNILAQTLVQGESPAYIRGRVLAMQFTLSNLVGIPPMLALGGLADTIGIPRAMEIVGLGAVGLALVSVVIARLPATAVTVTAPLSQSQEPQGEEA
ncbi:MAG: MFS transporter [Anaerolineae bacterium]|jgi:MFS family permease|nr:MFS transporter [Anaerolineae bacterium]